MAADCGLELKPHNVAFVSLWPGAVKTELVMQGAEARKAAGVPTGETANLGFNASVFAAFAEGESPQFAGKCIVALLQGMYPHNLPQTRAACIVDIEG